MTISRWLSIVGAFVFAGSASRAQTIVEWSTGSGGNGHFYQLVLVPSGVSWTSSNTAAQNAGGYLATLTSASENTFVFNYAFNYDDAWFIDQAGNGLGPWIGGVQTTFTSEPAGGWTWVTGESWSFTNWASGEPNNFAGGEMHLQLFGSQEMKAATWNDLTNTGNPPDTPARAYIIEYNVNPIPEPSTFAAMIGASALVFALWRRRASNGGRG